MNSECGLGNGQGMDKHIKYIRELVQKGGPNPSEYQNLNKCFVSIGNLIRNDEYTHSDIAKYWPTLGDVFSTKTMQGFVINKPHGYFGDFEIIDKIYQKHITSVDNLKNWDLFFHEQAAPKAVRNRKQYFINIIKEKLSKYHNSEPYKILNVGSGPARDVLDCFEYLNGNGSGNVYFDCVDQEPKANRYAKNICYKYLNQIKFHERNIFRLKVYDKYSLIWSAGLFDYLDKKLFISLLKRFLALCEPDGEIIIGNFSKNNPTRDYMEFAHWFLYHRDEEELIQLAVECGISDENIFVDKEPEGVNLFLRIKT